MIRRFFDAVTGVPTVMARLFVLLTVTTTLTAASGCQSMTDATRTSTRQVMRQFRPSPIDYRDPTNESQDQWADFTREARAIHTAEKDPDPWYRKLFMSEKARQTERHLGVN